MPANPHVTLHADTRSARAGCLILALLAAPLAAPQAQEGLVARPPGFTWQPARDAAIASGIVAAGWASSRYEVTWATKLQRPRIQQDRTYRNAATIARLAGDPGTLLLSGGVYGLGWAMHRPGLADGGRHATAAVLASGLATAVFKVVAGRSRPFVVHDTDHADFHAWQGVHGGRTSMPSGHTSAAFAVATAFSMELRPSHPRAARIVAPLFYAAAGAVGLSRMYNDRHWASDVVIGAGLGTLVARRVVQVAHAKGRKPGR